MADLRFGTDSDDIFTAIAEEAIFIGSGGDDSLTGSVEADSLFGNEGDDTLAGNAGDDLLDAGPGDDTVNTGLGDDLVFADAGDDTVGGMAGNDTVFGGRGNDSIAWNDPVGDLVFGDEDDDTIIGGNVAADTIFGGTGNDSIQAFATAPADATVGDEIDGQDGDDVILGGDAADTISGGAGNDTLTGNAGADTFVLAAGDDTIADFSPNTEVLIEFEGFGQEAAIPNGYESLEWNNFESVNGLTYFPPSGYERVINSGVGVGYNAFGDPASFASGTDFDLVSGYFAAAWNNGLNVTIEGWDNGQRVAARTLTLDPVKTFVEFDDSFRSINEVRVMTSGGSNAGLNGAGTQVAIDDLLLGFGDQDRIAVPVGTDIDALVASASAVGVGVQLTHAGGTLTLQGAVPGAASSEWFVAL